MRDLDSTTSSRHSSRMKTYCFRNNILVGHCRPTEQDAVEDAIRAGQAYRKGRKLIWRVPGEIAVCRN